MREHIVLAGLAVLMLAAAPAAPPLSAYTGRYPSDRVGGFSFWKNPTVRRAVQAAVTDPTIARDSLTWGVEDMVKDSGGMSLAWGCEAHNCGDHNGTVVIVRPRGPAAVCYHDAEAGGQTARWFIAGKLVSKADGACPSDVAPPDIAAALKRR